MSGDSGSGPASVHAAISAVMAAMPAIGKDENASAQQGGYAYRGIEAITGHAQPLFAEHGVVTVPQVRSVEVRDLVVNGKPWTDTTLVVDYTLVGPDGSTLTATCVGVGRDNSDKGANKAMTQAFKYLLLQLLCISDAKDDTDGTTVQADIVDAEPMASNTQKAQFIALCDAAEFDRKDRADFVATQVERDAWKYVTAAEADRLINTFKADGYSLAPDNKGGWLAFKEGTEPFALDDGDETGTYGVGEPDFVPGLAAARDATKGGKP